MKCFLSRLCVGLFATDQWRKNAQLSCPQSPLLEAWVSKKRGSLVINLDRKPKRLPCLVLDSSKEGFRLRGSFDLRRG